MPAARPAATVPNRPALMRTGWRRISDQQDRDRPLPLRPEEQDLTRGHVKSRLYLRYSFVRSEDGGRLNGKVYGSPLRKEQLTSLSHLGETRWSPAVCPVFPFGNKTFRDWRIKPRHTEENDLNHHPFGTPSIKSLEDCLQRALKRNRPSSPVLVLVQKTPRGTAGSTSPDHVAVWSRFIHHVCAPFTNT